MIEIKSFKIRKKKFVLKGSSIKLPNIGLVTISGPVGTGKSSFIKALYRGKIKVKGIRHNKFIKSCSYVAPAFNIVDGYTGNDYINRYKKYGRIDEEVLNNLFIELNIEHLRKSVLSSCSDGVKTRFFLCLGLSLNAQIVLIDEPTARVDKETADKVTEVLLRVSKSKLLLVATHDQEIWKVAQNLMIEEGRVVQKFSVEEENNDLKATKKLCTVKPLLKKIPLLITGFVTLIIGVISGILFSSCAEYYFPSKENYVLTKGVPEKMMFHNGLLNEYIVKIIETNNDMPYKLSPRFDTIDFNYGGQAIGNSLLLEQIPYLSNIFFYYVDEVFDGVKISRGLYDLLEKIVGRIDISSLYIRKFNCVDIVENDGILVYIPKAYAYNSIKSDYGILDYRKVFDKDGNEYELTDNSAAVPYYLFDELYGKKVGSFNIDSYYYDYDKKYIFKSLNEFHSADLVKYKGNCSLYAFSEAIRDSEYVEDFEREAYREYIGNTYFHYIQVLISIELCILILSFSVSYLMVRKNSKLIQLDLLDRPEVFKLSILNYNFAKMLILPVVSLLMIPLKVLFLNVKYKINIVYELIFILILIVLDFLFSFIAILVRIYQERKRVIW